MYYLILIFCYARLKYECSAYQVNVHLNELINECKLGELTVSSDTESSIVE